MLYINYMNNNNLLKFLLEEISWSTFNLIQFNITIYIWFMCIYGFFVQLNYKKYLINHTNTIVNVVAYIFFNYMIITSSSGISTTFWFNHLTLTNSTIKMTIAILLIFCIILPTTINSYNKNLKYINEFSIFLIFLTLWLINLFNCSNIFTLVFYFELLTITLMILLSNSNVYNNIQINTRCITFNNKTQNKPFYQIYSIILLFWISFITSFNLFFYLIYYIYYIQTFDLILIEYLLFFIKNNYSNYDLINIYFVWFGLLFTILLKLGTVPFFFWKPNFFKGLNLNYLYIYVIYFYFIFLIFIINLLTSYFNEFILLFIIYNLFIIYLSLLILIITLLNVTNLKIFIAYSSILNTLLVFIYVFLPNTLNIQYVYF